MAQVFQAENPPNRQSQGLAGLAFRHTSRTPVWVLSASPLGKDLAIFPWMTSAETPGKPHETSQDVHLGDPRGRLLSDRAWAITKGIHHGQLAFLDLQALPSLIFYRELGSCCCPNRVMVNLNHMPCFVQPRDHLQNA